MTSLLARVLDTFRGKAAEGAYRPGPYLLQDGGWLPAAWGQYANFWQLGYDPIYGGSNSAMVEACVSAYAQTLAMCQVNHWRDLDNGGRERVTNSALSRVTRAPNDYQTSSDFILNATRSLYLEGNAYALALRNDRFEIASLHLMHPRYCRAEVIGGEIFYALGGNQVIDARLDALAYGPLTYVPARDVFHVKLQTPRDILHGETPLGAAALAHAAGQAALAQSIAFFGNQSRPSGVLQTDMVLTPAQVQELRQRWDEQAKGLAAGGTPILTSGLKFEPISVSQADAQFAETMNYSDQQIAKAFRVPLAIIGSEAQPMGSTEALMNFWIGGGLGFALNQVELALDKVFGIARVDGEYSEFDTSILLRSAFKERIDGLARAVQGGIYSPNEARRLESLPAAKDGNEPRLQAQVVPLSAWDKQPTAPSAPSAPAAQTPADKVDDGDDEATDELADKMLTCVETTVADVRLDLTALNKTSNTLLEKVDVLDRKTDVLTANADVYAAALHAKTDMVHQMTALVHHATIQLREVIDEYGNVIRTPPYVGRARGLYDPNVTDYRAMDVVAHNGSEWRAKVDNPGPLPGDGWALGAKGARGKRGERGPPGPTVPGPMVATA